MDALDAIAVPAGPAAYAEPFDAQSFLKMPANALVNAAYLVVAAYWLAWALRLPAGDPRRPVRLRFVGFALLGALYGPIQFWRIVTQAQLPGVLDQWITLPFFGAFCAWASELLWPSTSPRRTLAILAASVASYALALLHPDGFVLALAVHLVVAVGLGVLLLSRAPADLAVPFAAALSCCVAFVALKQFDFSIAALPPFHRLTGHFWSKLGDAGQLHFALALFASAHRVLPRSR